MDIKEYIRGKKNISVCNLLNSKEIERLLNLDSYKIIESLDSYQRNMSVDNDVLILLVDTEHIISEEIFKLNYGVNNILLFVENSRQLEENLTKYKNVLFSYGYKYLGCEFDENIHFFIYDITDYKDNPDWLNSENWANPELWEK